MVQYKKQVSDQASVCTQREDRKWQYEMNGIASL